MAAALSCQRCEQGFEARRSDAMWCPTCRTARAKERSHLYERRQRASCPSCGVSMVRGALLCRSCDNKARSQRHLGEGNPSWKGGRTRAGGYVYHRIQPGSGGSAYRAEHILVWEQANGPLPKDWVVHHLNGIKDDNRLENLLAMPRKMHATRDLFGPYEERIRQLERANKHSMSSGRKQQ